MKDREEDPEQGKQNRQRPRGGNSMSKIERNKTGVVTKAKVTQALVSHTENLRQLAI